SAQVEASKPAHAAKLDRSGKTRKGKASYYSRRLAGKIMADGTRLNIRSDSAASRTLPLGTKVKVTNLENGRTAMARIDDRGPYTRGRIIDVSPATAKRLA